MVPMVTPRLSESTLWGGSFRPGSIKPSRMPRSMTSDRRLYLTPCPLDNPSRIIDTMSIFVLTAIFRPNSVLERVQFRLREAINDANVRRSRKRHKNKNSKTVVGRPGDQCDVSHRVPELGHHLAGYQNRRGERATADLRRPALPDRVPAVPVFRHGAP